jgi:hypothetical protein
MHSDKKWNQKNMEECDKRKSYDKRKTEVPILKYTEQDVKGVKERLREDEKFPP